VILPATALTTRHCPAGSHHLSIGGSVGDFLARHDGLPENWLNANATMWMPRLPDGALAPPSGPGLRVTFASDEFLLATKLIAQRRSRDASDIRQLAARTGLANASAEELEALIYGHYTDTGTLKFIVDGTDTAGEIRLLAEQAARMLNRRP
jgi:hypothetical protein